jgi:large subunit ribosomal protein L17
MRHHKGYAKLGRESSHRKAMLRNLATSFLSEGRIETSVQRAKALRPIVEKLITLGKDGSLSAKRKVLSALFTDVAAKKVFGDFAERFRERAGGYTRIVRLGERFGDGMERCYLEVVDFAAHEGQVKRQARERRQAAREKMAQDAAASAPIA